MTFLLLIMLPTVSVKADTVTVGDFIVTGGTLDTDYSYDSTFHYLWVKTSTPIDIKNVNTETPTEDSIVAFGATANITLSGVNIKSLESPIEVQNNTTLNLTLAEGTSNSLRVIEDGAGLNVQTNASLIIGGTGTLTAVGEWNGAGIGGQYNENNGEIIINSGTIFATSIRGAGIGSGGNYIGENMASTNGRITINGGTILAYSSGGAGIGTGYGCKGGTPGPIEINGGNITAIGTTDSGGSSGIGLGSNSTVCGQVTILKEANIIAIGSGTYGAITAPYGTGSTANILEADLYIWSGSIIELRDSSGVTPVNSYTFIYGPERRGSHIAFSVPDTGNYTLYKNNVKQQGTKDTVNSDLFYVATGLNVWKNVSDTHIVTWKSQDGATILETDSELLTGATPSYDGMVPTKAADAQYTYTFAGWATYQNPLSGTEAGSLPAVTWDTTYYAAFSRTVNQYNVTWKSQDGVTTLEIDNNVNYGTAPSYNGAAPTKAADTQYTYTFAGWAASANAESGTAVGSLAKVSGDTTYYAAFSKTERKYSVTWKSQDGATTLEADNSVSYGTAPTYDGATPTKAADAQYTYTFSGWATSANTESGTVAGSLPTVSGNTTYYAAFSKTERKYSVTWRSQDGKDILETDNDLSLGATPSYDGLTPAKAADAQYTYTFAGWATSANVEIGTAVGSLPKVNEDRIYYAAFSKAVNQYNVTWKSQDGATTLEADNSVSYGTAPTYDGATPTKAADAQYTYTFAGWATDPNAESGTTAGSLPTVIGNTTYYAAFSKTERKYSVTWKSQNGTDTLETDDNLSLGTGPSYDGEAPTKAADAQYTYTFAGWATSVNAESGTAAGSLPTVSEDTIYYAAFSKTVRSYNVTWKSQDGSAVLETDASINYGTAVSFDGITPTKAPDAQYTYTFAGWATTANSESGTAVGNLPTVVGDTVYYAAFSKTVNQYNVTWKSQDGTTTLETDANVNYGSTPSYDGAIPTKAADVQYTYTFAGWATTENAESGTAAESLPTVIGNTTYYAAFSKTVNKYNVTWKSQDGEATLETDNSVNYGAAPTYDGTAPTKAADAQYTYTFVGWATSANAESGTAAESLPTVIGNTTYYAAFSKTVRSYSVTWKSQDGATILETDSNVNYGTAPSYNGAVPTKAATAQYTYTFAGWATTANAESGTAAGSLPTVNGETTYYAAFSKAVNQYNVTWKSQDGATTLEADNNVNYGTAPTYDGETPTKAADAQYTYTFTGWATSANAETGTLAESLPMINGDATYYAAFSKTERKYSVTWKSQDGKDTLETDSDLSLGATPSFKGTEPTKAADAQYTYTFAGWAITANAESGTLTGSLPTVSEDATYYAAFSKTIRSYNVTWKSQDGSVVLEADASVNYGTASTYDGAIPTKTADAQYTYTFAGWATSANAESGTAEASLPTVSGDTTYYAAFSRMKITYPEDNGTGSNTTKPAGTIKKDQQREEGSPAATINNSVDDLKASVFTTEEKEKLAAGEDAKVTLLIKDISTSVSDADKKLVEKRLIEELQSSDQQNSETLNAAPAVLYVDISLFKQIGSEQAIKVTETRSKISISIEVPQSLWNTDSKNNRTYRAVRVHDTEVEILEGTYDPITHFFTFETDRFSTYALTYQDTIKIKTYNDFHHLQLKAKADMVSQTLSYKRAVNMDGYLIYGGKCGEEMMELADLPANVTSYTVKDLKKGTFYKYQVKAYRIIDGQQVIIMTSKVIHSMTEGKTYANPTKVTTDSTSVTLEVGKSQTVTSQVVLPKGKKLNEHTAAIRYESTNKAIATVNSKGKITAKAKGTCYVYAYAQNGVFKKLKVVVE